MGMQVTSAEEQIYRDIEHKRRLRLAQFLAPSLMFLQSFVFLGDVIAFVAEPAKTTLAYAGYIGTLASFGLFLLALPLIKRGDLNRAILCIVIALAITIFSPSVIRMAAQGFGPTVLTSIASYNLIIVLVGILTVNQAYTLGATVAVNLLTVGVIWFSPRAHDVSVAFSGESGIVGPLAIISQWGLAVLLLAALRIYTPAFRELGETQIAYERERQLDELKDQFITSVNHELRTPVMALQGYLELLLLKVDTMPLEQRRQLLIDANKVGDDLQVLITSILESRQLEQQANDFIPQAVNVWDVLQESIRLLNQHEPREKRWDLHLDIPHDLAIWGDRVRLQQVLLNLLSNAVKYSPAGSKIVITGRAIQKPGNDRQGADHQLAEIVIRDYGLGIPPEHIPLLFQRFVRLPRDLASSVSGNGLGLYLCQLYIEAMKGTIWVESTGVRGEGSQFTMHLPVEMRKEAGDG